MPTSTTVTYTRGTTYIENAYTDDGKACTAHGLVGTVSVHGQTYDAIERMDGYVKMKAGTYPNSSMYVDAKRGKVLNPWLGPTSEANRQLVNILFHAGSAPSHFEGCVGLGKIAKGSLTQSSEAMAALWTQCGGKVDSDKPLVTVVVVGEMPALAACTKDTR